jgi:hypothetical protein
LPAPARFTGGPSFRAFAKGWDTTNLNPAICHPERSAAKSRDPPLLFDRSSTI